jgi:hypothetical protein
VPLFRLTMESPNGHLFPLNRLASGWKSFY